MSNVWAEGGSIAVVPSEKISQGWVVEIPPCEQMNFVQNRQDAGIAYMLQQGIPEWGSSTEYQAGTSYVQSGSVVYKAIATGTNKPPTTFPEFWEQAFDASGSAQSVQDQLNTIKADADPFTQYLLETRATANGIDADLAVTSYLNATNLNLILSVGEYYFTNTCSGRPFEFGLMKVWRETNSIVYQQVQGASNTGLATRYYSGGIWSDWNYYTYGSSSVNIKTLQDQITALQSSLAAISEATRIKIGQLFLTSIDFLAPSEVTTHLGYGTWNRYGEGHALVSKSTQPLHPAWTKIQNNGFGSYTHTLSNDEIPAHTHSIPLNGSAAASYSTVAAGDTSSADYTMSTSSQGGSQAHNNVQPSVVVGIWYRTA